MFYEYTCKKCPLFPGTIMYHLRRYTPALAMQVGIEKNRIISPKKTFYTYYFSSKRPHTVAQPEKNMGELLKHHTYEKTIHCFFKFNYLHKQLENEKYSHNICTNSNKYINKICMKIAYIMTHCLSSIQQKFLQYATSFG